MNNAYNISLKKLNEEIANDIFKRRKSKVIKHSKLRNRNTINMKE